MIFAEDLNFVAIPLGRSWAKGMFREHSLDAGFGQFLTILSWGSRKRGVYFAVDKNYMSQICPNCGCHTGKKTLDNKRHICPVVLSQALCGDKTHRDVG